MSDHSIEKAKIDRMVKESLAMHDDTPLAELFSLVGCHLTGRKVFVRLRKPYRKGCRGMMLPSGYGRAVIDIDPDCSLSDQYMTFLHEVAHCRHHFYDINTGSVLEKPGSADLDPAKYEKPSVIAGEKEADAQADKWDAWASDPVRLAKVGYSGVYPVEFAKLEALAKIEVYGE